MSRIKKIPVNLKRNPYLIYVGNAIGAIIASSIRKLNLGNFGIIIVSRSVLKLYRNDIKKLLGHYPHRIICVPDGEKAKSKKWFFNVIDAIVNADGWNKRLFIVCFGGGVVGDLGGFIAAIYKRGIPYVQIPTTLLSQIDSSIGGKTGIDVKAAKNILGAFCQPKAVFIDTRYLKTLPRRELRQGIAEAIKYGIIQDKNLFSYLRQNHKKILNCNLSCMNAIVSRCAAIKARIVAVDEKEQKGIRTILNFGHTFAHALESVSQYTATPHGDAVGIGMVYAAELSARLKLCRPELAREIAGLLKLFSLPTTTTASHLKLYKSISYDKKFISGTIRMVIVREIGRVEVVDGIRPAQVKNALKSFTKRSV